MENKYINRYHTFFQSLENLEKSRHADPKADFVLEGTVQNFNMTFDISWKVMKDILIKRMSVMDFAVGSSRETLQAAYMNGLIFDDEWLQMLRVRNQLAHDYDGSLASKTFELIISVFFDCFEKFKNHVSKYYSDNALEPLDSFQ